MSTILFGSIGTIADTSELQRQAFNDAFAQHGLDWQWSQDEYRELLTGSGGADRVAEYAKSVGAGEEVDAKAIHATKSSLLQERLREDGVEPREGVAETIREGRSQGARFGFVTSTSGENVDAILAAVAPAISRDDFDVIIDLGDVQERKPAGDAYRLALEKLGAEASDCVAIEDNIGGVQAAAAEGVACVAFPNTNTAGHDFDGAARRVDALRFEELQAVAGDAA